MKRLCPWLCVHTYWWTWGWRSGWQQPAPPCGPQGVSPEPPGSHHTECPEGDTHTHSYTLPHTDHPSGVLPLSLTCFLRLFMTPMMLDSCLYSSLVAHFLSLFFLEPAAFSGETTPVMSAPGSVRLTGPPSQHRCQQCAVQLFVVAKLLPVWLLAAACSLLRY